MATLEEGAKFAGYRIEQFVSRGGMGVIYRATQLELQRTVALKLVAPELAEDDDFRARFKQESRLAAAIDHPNVIPIYEASEAGGSLFMAMRYVDGIDLRRLLSRDGALEPRRAADLVRQIGAALDAAHGRGLVHRDVKPGNVLIAGAPHEEHVYLTDFGLTKHAASVSGLTRTGQWVGTLDYVAPEQLTGEPVDARSDVYALGCLLYQTLTGSIPFAREGDAAKLWAHMNDPPPAVTPVRPELPRALDDVLARAMAKDPDARYPSAGDLGRAAVAAVEDRPLAAPERSVAAGAASPSAAGAAPTTERAGPPGSATGTLTAGTERLARSRGPARRLPLWVLALLATVIAGGGVVAGRASAGSTGNSPKSTPRDPNRQYAAELNAVFTELQILRDGDLSSLRRAGTSSAQSAADRRLFKDYSRAWRKIPHSAALTPGERGVSKQLVTALRDVGNAYNGMHSAADEQDAPRYAKFQKDLGTGQRKLRDALDALRKLGYEVA